MKTIKPLFYLILIVSVAGQLISSLLEPIQFGGFIIMLTYVLAQYFIMIGMVKRDE